MIDTKKYLLLYSLILATPSLLAETADDSDPAADLLGTVWQLVKNGSSNSSLAVGKLSIFYPVMHITPIGAENFKLGILFLWSMEEILCV